MKQFTLILFVLVFTQPLFSQDEEQRPKFYLGIAYGTSFSLGDFQATDIGNPDAGFAKNGQRFDIYGGYFLNEKQKVTLTAGLRYQKFETEIEDLIESFRDENPGAEVSGKTEDWQVYSFLLGLAYQVNIGRRFNFFPRVGIGPMLVTNPGITIDIPNGIFTNNFERSSESGVGFGYEFGIGLRTDLGRHFSLLPTFTLSGGWVTIQDVTVTTDNIGFMDDYQPFIQSFNIGLSLGYRFY
ncbi:MAG: outer membrane beta-barrel protein [Bacteroidota bacterium]